MIYFYQSIEGDPIRIGFTDDIEKKRDQLEAVYGSPAIFAVMGGSRKMRASYMLASPT